MRPASIRQALPVTRISLFDIHSDGTIILIRVSSVCLGSFIFSYPKDIDGQMVGQALKRQCSPDQDGRQRTQVE
jgi:hypothetical protein